jgi:hypothetical protein
VRDPRFKGRSLVCAFEGADAAGKGGAIRAHRRRRWTRATTRSSRWPRRPRRSAPSPTCGASGGICRATGGSRSSTAPGTAACWSSASRASAAEADWLRAYSEINDFEHAADAGVIVVKFWLQISQEEQLRRFKEREKIEFKRFKITEEDWRNREKWDAYQAGGLRHGRPHQHRPHRAVDAGRGQ